VSVTLPGELPRTLDPAPAYDDDIPHDLVHYVVEAELGLTSGVYGRAARGAGTFIMTQGQDESPRERARKQRKQRKLEQALSARDARGSADMARSEHLAALCDLAFRRKHGQRPDPARAAPLLGTERASDIERVVARLDTLAPEWRALPVGGELVFEWPSVAPKHAGARDR
jgi:hypothetical protein